MGWNLAELIQRHKVPGAQVAVLANGEIEDHAAGLLSLHTRIETTPDSVFQIGSITKIWTATLAQKLVNERVLDLDCPIRSYLPEFELSDPVATESATARHLLTHTNGIDGNLFTDTGQDDGAIARFVATLSTAEQLFLPGAMFSYCNTGYAVLGRLIEVLRGKPFHDVLRSGLVTPLGLNTVSTNAYEAILHRAAVGHDQGAPVRTWALAYSNSPGGAQLAMSARDLLTFVRLHLTDEFAVLREPQVTVPPNLGVPRWGLGWMLLGDGVVGHTGTTLGQKAFLRVVPEAGVAVAVLTNSLGGPGLAHEVFTHTLRELAGVETPPRVTPPANPAPLDDTMFGTYRGTKVDYVLTNEDGRAFLSYVPRDALGAEFIGEHRRDEVVRLDDTSIITLEPDFGTHYVATFVGRDSEGRPKWLHNTNACYRIA
ncbi:serine hydrolase domain-containing protein [Lentzea sp. BCCO 10_0856]|uniref:Serine hydrolase domain-containing protein n=1 Tax=Lentzea miocenica TaxID=3095431 RepID=A0ABU4SSI7_9PSEU|nr:serine hydrolase domain-containing protein [Lentzea sp. BCCO 10_0856]MDX8028860.1 serine hydrolase domain-containing protein [Lentzea sp. BCCO 10_0856]